MSDTMYCSKCSKTLPLALFFDGNHGRYLAHCLPCRRGLTAQPVQPEKKPKLVKAKVVNLNRNLSARVDGPPRRREPQSNIALVANARIAQSIKYVVDQL